MLSCHKNLFQSNRYTISSACGCSKIIELGQCTYKTGYVTTLPQESAFISLFRAGISNHVFQCVYELFLQAAKIQILYPYLAQK